MAYNRTGDPKVKARLVRNAVIFAFGLFGMVVGTYVSMLNIVNNFKKEEEI